MTRDRWQRKSPPKQRKKLGWGPRPSSALLLAGGGWRAYGNEAHYVRRKDTRRTGRHSARAHIGPERRNYLQHQIQVNYRDSVRRCSVRENSKGVIGTIDIPGWALIGGHGMWVATLLEGIRVGGFNLWKAACYPFIERINTVERKLEPDSRDDVGARLRAAAGLLRQNTLMASSLRDRDRTCGCQPINEI